MNKSFVNQVMKDIKNYLPEEYADAEVNVQLVQKPNGETKLGLVIKQPGKTDGISPIVYLDEMYEQMLTQVAELYLQSTKSLIMESEDQISRVMDYINIKEKLICQLVNTEQNREYLQDKPYTLVKDLAVVYCIVWGKSENETATIVVTDAMLQAYGITVGELHQQAVENMECLYPHTLRNMNEILVEIASHYGADASAFLNYAENRRI